MSLGAKVRGRPQTHLGDIGEHWTKTSSSTDLRKYIREAFEGKYRVANPQSEVLCATRLEEIIKEILIENQVDYFYEFCRFPLSDAVAKSALNGKNGKIKREHNGKPWSPPCYFTPDYITDITIDGRRVVLEPHGGAFFEERDVEKFRLFMERYGAWCHLVIITDLESETLNAMLMKAGIEQKSIANEIWNIHEMGSYMEPGSLPGVFLRLKFAELKLRALGILRTEPQKRQAQSVTTVPL